MPSSRVATWQAAEADGRSLSKQRAKLSFDLVLAIFLLSVLANVAYCAAYLADLFVQFAGLQGPWRWGRMVLLAIGTMFAATITHFFAKGMFVV